MARVLLLFGGRSAEHEVSCTSAVAVMEALREAGHRVIPVGVSKQGAWFLADGSRRPLYAEGREVSLQVPEGRLTSGNDEVTFDVVFPVLHGPFGEDGTIQGALEMTGVPYVGCSVLSSALAMEKDLAKRLFVAAGLRTARWLVVRSGNMEDAAAVVDGVIDDLGLPVFVKPAQLGSSVGVSRATTEAEVKEGLEEAFRYGKKALVEEAIRGREIEVAVLDGKASVPGEVITRTDWYDYEAKYHDETSEFVAPAALNEAQQARVRLLAEQAFRLLECRALARVDFLFEEGGRGFLLNEVNTMPGFTPISGYPKMCIASGMTYAELCDELVKIALRG
jgi:D-alanine-D-alanine ligase